MGNTDQSVVMVLDILKEGYKQTSKDAYGFNFVSKNRSHVVHVGCASITFEHPTNRDMCYVFGINKFEQIKRFVHHPPSFDEKAFLARRAEQAAARQAEKSAKSARSRNPNSIKRRPKKS